jgi:hypothetical protein
MLTKGDEKFLLIIPGTFKVFTLPEKLQRLQLLRVRVELCMQAEFRERVEHLSTSLGTRYVAFPSTMTCTSRPVQDLHVRATPEPTYVV